MNKFIADKNFYKRVLAISVPIMVQNGITNFVNLLDNIMVGQIGTAEMSGVAIVNQIIFVFTLCVFGGCAGAGIFTAQYYGTGDNEGVRNTTRYKLYVALFLLIVGISVMLTFGEPLISAFLSKDSDPASVQIALSSGKTYLKIMMIGLVPSAIVQVYASTLRETGETVVPMKAGSAAIAVNLVFNYILIFDHFGHKGLGVAGAAIATVMSRFVELAVIVIWSHKHTEEKPFFKGLYKSFKLPRELIKTVTIKGMPLLVNEALWSLGMSMLLQCYSVRGLDVVAAMNISNVIANIFNIVFIALGDAIAIIIGQLLGAGRMEEAEETDRKMLFFSTVLCLGIGIILILLAPVFPEMYNTEKNVKELAATFIRIVGMCLPLHAFLHGTYFTLRSGGKTIITFVFDSAYMWVVTVVFAFVLTRFTTLPIIPIFFIIQVSDILKAIVGFILLKKKIWLNNIVESI